MHRVPWTFHLLAALAVSSLFSASAAFAGEITTSNILAIPQHVVGSGNGTLDLRMFTSSGSEVQNSTGNFNGDNANTVLPHGSTADTLQFAESYVTTAGDLKNYYRLNFATGAVNEVVLFLDLNETGGGSPTNTLAKLDIVLNPTSIQGNPKPLGDVSSSAQDSIKQVYAGGVTLAHLNPQPANNIPVNSQGAGFADYAIYTGINPFLFNDSDVLLFNLSMANLSNGSEEIFLSGTYSATDVAPVPEPGSACLLGLGVAALLWRQTRKACKKAQTSVRLRPVKVKADTRRH
jgi:PEP-CTERM motif